MKNNDKFEYGLFNLDSGEWITDEGGKALYFVNRQLAQYGAATAGVLRVDAFISRSLPAELDRQPAPISTLAELRLAFSKPTGTRQPDQKPATTHA